MSRSELLREIDRLGGYEGSGPEPLVSLELFFDGNEDEASIACNLEPHPGVGEIAGVLRGIRARPDVLDVLVGINEVMSDEEWPFSDHVYVITTASDAAVEKWAKTLQCDAPSEGWWNDAAPVNAPNVPSGARVVVLWWD